MVDDYEKLVIKEFALIHTGVFYMDMDHTCEELSQPELLTLEHIGLVRYKESFRPAFEAILREVFLECGPPEGMEDDTSCEEYIDLKLPSCIFGYPAPEWLIHEANEELDQQPAGDQ